MRHGADAGGGIYPHREATGPLTLAVERGYEEIAAIIREEEHRRQTGGPEPADTDLPSEIAQAFQRGDVATIMEFLEKHPEQIRLADPRNGVTPLHKSAAFLLNRWRPGCWIAVPIPTR